MQKKAPTYPIESVDRALRLLRLVAADGSLRLSDASATLGLALSSTHRLLAMLEWHGFVTREAGGRQYLAGPTLLELGWTPAGDDLRGVARPHLLRLTQQYGETTHLLLLRGRRTDFVDGVEGERSVRVGLRLGQSMPAHATTGGKAMLAAMAPSVLDQLYPEEELERITTRTVPTKRDLLGQLDRVRQTGYAINDGETEVDLRAVGAAIVDRHGRPRAAIAISGPASRLPHSDLPVLGGAVADEARQIAGKLA
ncbi:MAG: IclR family transcriptional regulator [Geodermatophilaceae bacterium]|nr:IclR family transcriptional regulator [Geodermatophilaceae bacterium]